MGTLKQETIRTKPHIPAQILVMDDEVSVAKGLQMVMTEEGYLTDWAMTGQSALDKCREKAFDLLLADLRLPDIDGMEVIKQVRKKQPATEAIVITGYPSVASAVESVKAGVFEYIRKPFTDDEIKKAVVGALKKKQKTNFEGLIVETENKRLLQKQEVIRVLDRTSQDADFWRELMEKGSNALEGYQLSSAAKAAIASGDLGWIKKHVGELTEKQLMFIYKRLEREAW
ncbi:MAG: response regulator [Thermodesulfobacteriota bacterium]|nr:response regulator [Thermodesulfobacteriota bacterium]